METVVLQQAWNGLVTGFGYTLFALGLTLLFGAMRVVNMGHGELYMLGAMVGYSLIAYLEINYFLALVLSTAILGLFGMVFNQLAVQPLIGRPMHTTLLSTIAMSFILLNGATIIWGSYPKSVETPWPGVLKLGAISITIDSLVVLVIGVAALVGLYLFLAKVKLGKGIRAITQSIRGAGLVGINVRQIYTVTVCLASALAGLAGILLAAVLHAVPYMGQYILIKGFAIVVVAGMGNILGCVVIGLFLGVTEALFGQYISTYYMDAYAYVVMIIILLVKPKGLLGEK